VGAALDLAIESMQALWERKGETRQMFGFVLASALFGIIPNSGILNTIFHQTDITVQVLDWPPKGYHLNLIQLIILLVLAVVVNAVTKYLTKSESGGLVTGVILTIIGAYLLETYARIPFDFALEGVLIIASLLGAIIVGVFYTLIRARFKRSDKK
jgi:uncharacterized membrane protein YeaQ/YmgE (transglycosylase-associated protein family)